MKTPKNPSNDRNFDDLATRFTRTIYDSPRGRLRLAALWQDFLDANIALPNKRVLDVGGGQGQFSLRLAKRGACIDLIDTSQEMLALAKDNFANAACDINIDCLALQQLPETYHTTFDIVLNHAVLEWLADPLDALPILCEHVKPGGWLSLMVYTRHGHQWRQLTNGRIHNAQGSTTRLQEEGNAPKHAFEPTELIRMIETTHDMRLERWRGVRCLYDHMHPKARGCYSESELIEADLHWGLQEPYKQFGRYAHLLFRKHG